jgi:RNA polymerase sigma-54 factor
MALDVRQSLKLTQSLLMTPQLQQAIKLLQLGRMELEQFVSQQLSENPVLEETQPESMEEQVLVERERERTTDDVMREQTSQAAEIFDAVPGDGRKDEVDWEAMSRIKEAGQQSASATRLSNAEEAPNYENIVTKAETLADYLQEQTGELDLTPEERIIASHIIGNISDRGYLEISLDELAQTENIPIQDLEDILDTIQRFDPPGVGARNLQECLLIQLRDHGLKNGIVEKIVLNHMQELETRNYAQIAKALGVTIQAVIENAALIAELDPIPGRQYGADSAQYVIPDVYVFKHGGEWIVSMNEDGLPRLRVNDGYQEMLGDKIKAGDKEYLQEKVRSAQWLIKSIQQRQRTIFRTTECIVKRQVEFFEHGVHCLKPMILKDIAEDISMHESTISRVTTNKFVHTPRGIFELKYFFNSSVAGSDGSDLASESVKVRIKEIVGREDAKRPFSDQKIVEFLEDQGIQLARRTVAKYREQLGILPSSKRKKYF